MHRITFRALTYVQLLAPAIGFVVCLAAQVAWAEDTSVDALAPGSGQIRFVNPEGDPDQSIRVYYVKPAKTQPNTPVWFVMHGVKRNAEEYRDKWVELSERYRAIVLVPEFNNNDYPGSRAYNLGNMFDEQGEVVDRSLWSYTLIDKMFEHVQARENLRANGYCIYGHSAGAQFVHRLVLFVPEARVRIAVSANAGWYTMPLTDVGFPYGLKGTAVDEPGLLAALGKPMLVLLGAKDNDPNHKYLRKTPEAEAQGPHRLARGYRFYETARTHAKTAQVRLGWRCVKVPDVGHSNTGMAPVAARHMARAPKLRKRESQ